VPAFLGPWELLIVAVVLLLLFGPARLPRLGRAAGTTAKDFKDAIASVTRDEERPSAKA
jgi:sec-independent protein translocase protein TatA